MTKLQILRTLYGSGIVIQWGYTTHGWYPLRPIGRLFLRVKIKQGVISWKSSNQAQG
jgi:hypothetical protein